MNGRPIAEEEIDVVIRQVVKGVDLRPADHLLDLCCGNGLLTVRMAEECLIAAGVDFTRRMIELAREYHSRENLRYYESSIIDLQPEIFSAGLPFNRVTMIESLQYFERSELPIILESIGSVSTSNVRLYFAGVLDQRKIWSFYDTLERRTGRDRAIAQATDPLGTWWAPEELEDTARASGFRCEFLDQDLRLNTAHYRFDVRLEKV